MVIIEKLSDGSMLMFETAASTRAADDNEWIELLDIDGQVFRRLPATRYLVLSEPTETADPLRRQPASA